MGDKDTGSAVYNILAFCFDGQKTANQIVKEIKSSGALEGYEIVAQAVVEQDAKGKVHYHEPGRGGVGTTVGAVAGGLIGLIGGPAGLLAWAVGGGVVGGIAGHHLGRIIPASDLKEFGAALQPDTSAFMLMVEDVYSESIIDSTSGYNANVVTLTVGDELSGEIASFVAGEAHDDAGNVVAGAGGVAAAVDDEGNVAVVGGGEVVAATGD